MKILITGGCGFVGSNLAIYLKKNKIGSKIHSLDNLSRSGTLLNFQRLKKNRRSGLGIFITAGDPNIKISQRILNELPKNGADFIELGMPFSDPMADGPVIQASSLRALKAGMNLSKILLMVKNFRKINNYLICLFVIFYFLFVIICFLMI